MNNPRAQLVYTHTTGTLSLAQKLPATIADLGVERSDWRASTANQKPRLVYCFPGSWWPKL